MRLVVAAIAGCMLGGTLGAFAVAMLAVGKDRR